MIPVGGKKLLLAGGISDPDARATIGRMVPRPNGTRRRLITKTIVDLKAAGLWQVMDGIWFLAAHTEQAAFINWKQNRFNLVKVGSGVTTADRGFQSGATSALKTGFVYGTTTSVVYARNNAHMAAWAATPTQPSSGNLSSIMGAFTQGQSWLTGRSNVGTAIARINDVAEVATITNNGAETMLRGNRSVSTSLVAALNGAAPVTAASTSDPLDAARMTMVGANGLSEDGNTFGQSEERLIRFACFGSALPSMDATFYNIVRNYLLGVGAIT